MQDETLGRLRVALLARGSKLADESSVDRNLAHHTRSILKEVLESDASIQLVSHDYDGSRHLAATGESAAVQDIDPAEPLMAAEVLFSVALDVLAEGNPGMDPLVLARRLHHAIWSRFPPGAIAYVDVLRKQLASARTESLKELSRELHDEILPLMSIAGYSLDGFFSDGNQSHVDEARRHIQSALETSQAVAFDIRQSVGALSISEALHRHVQVLHEDGANVLFQELGNSTVVSSRLKEEIFSIALEAIRNARRHGGSNVQVEMDLRWSPNEVALVVVDDGGGVKKAPRKNALGMTGMQERAQRIGGTFSLDPQANGLRVMVLVPLGGSVQ